MLEYLYGKMFISKIAGGTGKEDEIKNTFINLKKWSPHSISM